MGRTEPLAGVHATTGVASVPSAAVAVKVTRAPVGAVALTANPAGTVRTGARRSMRLPLIGPATRQLPATSQTLRVAVEALAVSSPSAMDVRSVNRPSTA